MVISGCLLIPLTAPEQAQIGVFSAVSIQACGTGLVTPSLRSLVSRQLNTEGQGTALGSLQALQSLGSFLGPPVAGLSYDLLGQTRPFLASATMLIAVMLLVGGSPRLQKISDP